MEEIIERPQNDIHSCFVELQSHGFQIGPLGPTQKQSEETKNNSTFQINSYKILFRVDKIQGYSHKVSNNNWKKYN